jgi:hypothetical protein
MSTMRKRTTAAYGPQSELRAKGEGPWSPEALEEDERRLAEFERTRMGVPWDEVKVWMQSWGKPNELPMPKPRKL